MICTKRLATKYFRLLCAAAVFALFTLAFGAGHAGAQVHENGIGPDPDNDTNPATITGVIERIGDAAQIADDAPYRVITFEPPPGTHGEPIREAYAKNFGVHFGPGLKQQICEGQRRFYYDSMCTYEAAPSGAYAVGFASYLNKPLRVEFDTPVCVVTMAIYPTGGREGEPFTVTIEGWDENGIPLESAEAKFKWTRNTVRWRHMAGAYYLGGRAKKIAISMSSDHRRFSGDVVRFLIDDFAFVQDDCENVLADFEGSQLLDQELNAMLIDDEPIDDALIDGFEDDETDLDDFIEGS